jgi:hypothetical protein
MNEESIFLTALDIAEPAERAAYLAQACAGDAALRRRVEALLAAHARSGPFLDVPVLRQMAGGAAEDQPGPAATSAEAPGDRGEIDLSFLPPSTRPGSLGRLGHHEVEAVIGRGGCGIVLKAFDVLLQRTVALKVLAPELAATSPARKRFLREARAAAALRHEHVIGIHAVEEQPIPYLVMEYIAGPTLQQRLDQTGPLDVPEVVRFGQQIASGLAAAHALGLIHRDITPGNLLLETGRDHIKITDFGLARSADDASLTHSGVIVGTPLYMSPEQAQGGALDPRSDLFSLGSVLYVMCSGRPPFRAATTLAVLRRVAEDQPRPIREIIPEVPEWLVAVIARLHAKQPADRFASAQEVAELLGRCRSELQQHGRVAGATFPPLPAGREGLGAKGSHDASARRHPRRRWLAAAVLIGILLAGLGLTEATGITDVRGTVLRLFAPDDTPAARPPLPIEGDGGVSAARTARFVRGNWRIVGDVIEHPEKNRRAMLLFGAPTFSDGDFTCEAMRSEGDHGLALVARATDLENYYYFDIGVFQNAWHSLHAKEAGADWRRLDQRPAPPVPTDRWVKLRLRLRGNTFEAYLDDQLVLSGSDDRRPQGYLGLRTWNEAGKYRNLQFTAPSGKVLWEGLPVLDAARPE